MGRWEWLDLKRPLFFQILVFKYSERDCVTIFILEKLKNAAIFCFYINMLLQTINNYLGMCVSHRLFCIVPVGNVVWNLT